MASSDSNGQLNSIARMDESKGAAVHSFDPDSTPQQKAAAAGKAREKLQPIQKQVHPSGGQELPVDASAFPTITVEDVDKPPQANGSPAVSSQPSLPGSLNGPAPSIPDWYKVGWRAVSGVDSPHVDGVEQDQSVLAAFLHEQYYGHWYYNAGIIFFSVFATHFFTRFNFGWGWLIIILAICCTYYSTSMARLRTRVRDDVQRELVKTSLPSEHESAEWLNHFLDRFWRIYEPVLSASIVNTVDQILSTNCPPFLDSLRLSLFTLGNKSFRITKVQTSPHTEEEIVMMDWSISFQPNDISDLTQDEIKKRVNSKIVLSIRLGKGLATASMPVLVEDLSFSGVMRVRMKLMTNFPHIQLVDLSFLEEPRFDYSLKPIGGDTFGFDIAHIPGLSNFIRDMVHSNLRPMMYDPNVFTINLEQLLSGAPLDSAIGVLQVTIHSARGIKGTKLGGGIPDPFVSISINNRAVLAKTQYKRKTYNPTWMETKFFLINSLTEPLFLSLYDYNEHRSHFLMGAATFNLQALNDDASQENITEKILKDGKDHGEIRFEVKFYPTLSPTSDGGVTPLPKTNIGIVRLVVHQAKDLDSTKSLAGDLNPFVKVYLGKEAEAVHKSALVKHTNNPIWESAAEFLCANRQTSVVTIKVIDDRDFMKDPIIGQVTVRLEDLLDAMEYPGKDWWLLTGCNNGRIRLSTEWKPLDMAGSLHGANQYVPPIGVVRLWLHKATDVKNVEATLGGKSDPYVRVQVKNVTLARTDVINNDLNPVWDQIVYVPVHSLKENLLLECMDYQHLTKDRSLGSVELQMSELATKADAVDYPYKSSGKKTVADPIRQDKNHTSKGQLHYEAEFIPAIALRGVGFKDQTKNAAEDQENDTTGYANNDGGSVSSLEVDHHSGFVGITATAPIGVNKSHKQTKSTDTIASTNSNVANGADIAGEIPTASSPELGISHIPEDGTEDKEQDKEEEQGVSMNKEELMQHQSGIVVFNVIGGKLSKKARLEVLLDDGYWPVFSTTPARSVNASWELIGEGFIRELDFGQVWLRLNEAQDGDTDDIIGEWKEGAKKFLEEALDGPVTRTLLNEDGVSTGTIQLEARFVPVPVKLEPRESINNQGSLSVVLLDGHDILAIDRGGKSDPFAVFTLNGQRVHKSQTKKKTLSPEWNEDFQVSVPSRVNANFQVELFDWNQVEQAKTLGVGHIELLDLEPFQGIERIIPLSNKHGEKGQIRLRLNFRPQIIVKSRKNTSTFSVAGRAMTQIGSLPVGAGKGAFHGVTSVFKNLGHVDEEEPVFPVPPIPSEQASYPDVSHGKGGNGALLPSMNTATAQVGNTNLPGTLRVTVLDAKNFNTSGDSVKPYVVLRCGDKEHKTKHASKTIAECSWNESFTFVASPATQPKIFAWIFDYKTLTKDKQLGVCEIDIWRHLKSTGMSTADVLIEFREGQGQLSVRLEYDPDNHTLTRIPSSSSDRIVSSSSRFSIRSLRPGASNDD